MAHTSIVQSIRVPGSVIARLLRSTAAAFLKFITKFRFFIRPCDSERVNQIQQLSRSLAERRNPSWPLDEPTRPTTMLYDLRTDVASDGSAIAASYRASTSDESHHFVQVKVQTGDRAFADPSALIARGLSPPRRLPPPISSETHMEQRKADAER